MSAVVALGHFITAGAANVVAALFSRVNIRNVVQLPGGFERLILLPWWLQALQYFDIHDHVVAAI